ncbi:Septation initiation network scaffold protein cdc11 [Rhizoctonia solani]|uniref:Septation initiation network scaffold protein cdc11 n=1 Tax=Rhizoctonia solani TaxID=456999 RepID=A0A8H8NVW6_9AGAM|nr:Septation initiation network scaffold protein cdc11 [Rhizoctonia solani]QRW20345.1 Septation initiation network scaffold protein cdc11 [Rhizoctonia solani]
MEGMMAMALSDRVEVSQAQNLDVTQVHGSVRVALAPPPNASSSSVGEVNTRITSGRRKRKKKLSLQPGTSSSSSEPRSPPTVGTFLVIYKSRLKLPPLKEVGSQKLLYTTGIGTNPPPIPQATTTLGPNPTPTIHRFSYSYHNYHRPTASSSSPSTSHQPPLPSTPLLEIRHQVLMPPQSLSSAFAPSPSAGRGPLGTFRLPHHHAPLRPSRSESHLVKPYESFEAEESSQSSASVSRDILADMSNIQHEERPFGSDPETSHSGKIPNIIEEDDERLTNGLSFSGNDSGSKRRKDIDEADSILDPTLSDFEGQLEQESERAQIPTRQGPAGEYRLEALVPRELEYGRASIARGLPDPVAGFIIRLPRDQLSALVDSIAVGSVGSSPSFQQVNTMEFRGDDPHALSTPSDAVRYAKKIKLTPPEDFSDWDGERSGEEQADGEATDNDAEGYHSSSRIDSYADATGLSMQATRGAHSFDDESVSPIQQGTELEDGEGEGDMDMDMDEEVQSSSGSATNDYRRRGADLMAQLREEFSDDEEGSMREGSIMTRDGSTSGGSPIIKGFNSLQPHRPNQQALSPSDLVVNRDPLSSFGRRTPLQNSRNQDPVPQLSSLMLTVELNDKAGSVKSGPRPFLGKLSTVDELSHSVIRDADLVEPPKMPLLKQARNHPALANTYRSRERPASPTRYDMNRFVSSSSTADTKTSTARSADSYVKHPGPPIPGVRQIVPSDLPAEALPERVGRMVYDRAAMRWRQEVDENVSESEDPFRDFDSFASTVEEQEREGQGLRPMEEVDEHEVDIEQDSTSDSNVTLNDPAKALNGQKAPQSTITYDSDVSTELNVVDVSPTASPTNLDGDDLKLYEPSPKSAPVDLDHHDNDHGHEPETCEHEPTNIEIPTARPVGPLRPALKSAVSTPAASAGSSRRSTPDFTPMQNAQSRRSVSFSDGRIELTSLTLTTPESEAAPSSRMQRIGNLLDALEDDSMLANLSIAPGKQPPGESDEDEDTTEQFDTGRGDPDVDPDVSRNPRSFARTYSFGTSDRTGGQKNPTFLTECSFGVAHDRLVELITDVHPYQPYWEPLSEIDLSKKGIESLARLKEFLPNLDRLNVHGNELAYLSGIPSCLRDLNAAQNQLTSMTSYSHLANLEVLDISNNQIDSVAQLRCLRHLRELSAAGNTISSLSGIDQTTSLVKVNLKGNCLKSVSLEDCSWPHIDSIDFSNNGMKTIAGLSSVPTLVTLNLDHNALAELHVNTPLPRLRNLRLSDNKLAELDCSSFVNLRTLYVDNNKLGALRHVEKARRLENLSLRNQSGRGLHLCMSHIRDVKRLYLSGNPLDPGFLEVPCYNLVYLELAACRLSSLPPICGLMRLRKLTVIGSRLKATKPLLRSLQSMKELEMLDFRMNPFSLGWYLPLLVRDVPGALQPSETNGKNTPWSDLDVKFRRDLPDELYIGRLAYRGLVMRVCPQVRIMDGIEITQPERTKAQKLLLGIEQSHKASMNPPPPQD